MSQVRGLQDEGHEIVCLDHQHDWNSMMGQVSKNSKQLFSPPILKFTLISIVINFSFHIG